jgi:hypothetical protein
MINRDLLLLADEVIKLNKAGNFWNGADLIGAAAQPVV